MFLHIRRCIKGDAQRGGRWGDVVRRLDRKKSKETRREGDGEGGGGGTSYNESLEKMSKETVRCDGEGGRGGGGETFRDDSSEERSEYTYIDEIDA